MPLTRPQLFLTGSLDNLYANGHVIVNTSRTALPQYDYAFRTYFDDASSNQVPEPGALNLLLAGFAGWAATRRVGK